MQVCKVFERSIDALRPHPRHCALTPKGATRPLVEVKPMHKLAAG